MIYIDTCTTSDCKEKTLRAFNLTQAKKTTPTNTKKDDYEVRDAKVINILTDLMVEVPVFHVQVLT